MRLWHLLKSRARAKRADSFVSFATFLNCIYNESGVGNIISRDYDSKLKDLRDKLKRTKEDLLKSTSPGQLEWDNPNFGPRLEQVKDERESGV